MVEFSKQSVGIKCIEIHPNYSGEIDVNSMRTDMQKDGVTSIDILRNDRKIVLLQATPGFGKTKLMGMRAQVPTHLVTFILLPSDTLETQMTKDFKDGGIDVAYISLDSKNIIRDISNNIQEKKHTVIFCSNISHINGKPTKFSQQFIDVLGELHKQNITNLCQVLIDEMDTQLTSLTGGATKDGGFNTSETNTLAYKNIKTRASVNIFDVLRKYNIFAVGLSGTLHSLTTSRLPLLGYNLEDIGAVCIYPIKELYRNHDLRYSVNLKPNSKSFEHIYHEYMEQVENSGGIIMLTFPNESYINIFKAWYLTKTGREMSCVVYTSQTKERDSDLKNQIDTLKYIIGIDMLTTGFNLPSYTSRYLDLHIIFRQLSDKATNPISNSPDQFDLYSPQSSIMIQAICRQRQGGITVIPSPSSYKKKKDDESSKPQLYDLLVCISKCFVKGLQLWNGFSSVGSTDTLRYAQCTLIGFKLNIECKECCDNVRKTIEKDCKQMEKKCGKNFMEDVLNASNGGPPIDYDFWAGVIERFLDSLCDKEEEVNLPYTQALPLDSLPSELVVVRGQNASALLTSVGDRRSPPCITFRHAEEVTFDDIRCLEASSINATILRISAWESPSEVNLYSGLGCPRASYHERDIHLSGLMPRIEVNSSVDVQSTQHCIAVGGTEVATMIVPPLPNSSDDLRSHKVTGEVCPLTNHLYEPLPSDKPLPHPVCFTHSHIEYSRTITGGGIGKSRGVDTNVHQKLKAYSVCGLCSTEFYPGFITEIAHIHEVRHGGSYSEDNLMHLCKICHAGIDSHQIILDPEGRAWFTPLLPLNVVNVEQYCNVSLDNILRRWDDAKSHNNCSSDEELYRLLEERRYRYHSVI